MAEIVLGIGCAHTPQLHTMAKDWHLRGDRDQKDGVPFWYKGKKMKYADVEAMRKSEGFNPDTSVEFGDNLLQRGYRVIDDLHEVYKKAAPDVMIIFGNDQHEIFYDQIQPAFAILGCEEFENMPRREDQKSRLPIGIDISDHGHLPDDRNVYPGHPELAEHMIRSVIDEEFDVAWSKSQPKVEDHKSVMSGMPHAYGFIYKQIMRDRVIPHVPCNTNTFFGPNQPKASRCVDWGRAIGRAIESWDSDARVCIVASGGLSHFLVDDAWDEIFLKALEDNDLKKMTDYHEGYYQAGSSECKSWLACAAALEHTGLKAKTQDYFPLYRTPGGTGSSCGFMLWE